MNSATLKTIREVVGLTVQAAADLNGVSLRTWQRFEAPDFSKPIPADIADTLMGMLNRQLNTVEAVLDMADDVPDPNVTRYRTEGALHRNHPGYPGGLTVHNATVAAVMAALAGEGKAVEVLWDDDPRAAVGTDFQ